MVQQAGRICLFSQFLSQNKNVFINYQLFSPLTCLSNATHLVEQNTDIQLTEVSSQGLFISHWMKI